MNNWGIKIAKDNSDINSSNPNDYKFWSRYNSLTLVNTVDITFNVEGSSSGTESFAHGQDYTPFVFVKYTGTSFSNSLLPSEEVLPVSFSDGLSEGGTITAYDPFFDTSFEPIFGSLVLTYSVDDTNINISWSVSGFEGGGGYSGYFTGWDLKDITFTVTASIYSFDLSRIIS